MSFVIRKGDLVKITTGKDKGKTGKVLEMRPKTDRLVVEGVNLVTRHRKPRRNGEKGQKLVKPSAINKSSVMLICGSCGKPTRVGFALEENGLKNRICKKCGKGVTQ